MSGLGPNVARRYLVPRDHQPEISIFARVLAHSRSAFWLTLGTFWWDAATCDVLCKIADH